jgi:hypothetical protein
LSLPFFFVFVFVSVFVSVFVLSCLALSSLVLSYPMFLLWCASPTFVSIAYMRVDLALLRVVDCLSFFCSFFSIIRIFMYVCVCMYVCMHVCRFVFCEGNDGDPQDWPLIRKVVMHGPWPILATGAQLVDLPGVRDSNKARATVAEAYLKNCHSIWIVAPIKRAVDDGSAKGLKHQKKKKKKFIPSFFHKKHRGLRNEGGGWRVKGGG